MPALTGVFAEALRGGVSNLSFGELSGNLGAWAAWGQRGWGGSHARLGGAGWPGLTTAARRHPPYTLPSALPTHHAICPSPQAAPCTSSTSGYRPTTRCSCAACRCWRCGGGGGGVGLCRGWSAACLPVSRQPASSAMARFTPASVCSAAARCFPALALMVPPAPPAVPGHRAGQRPRLQGAGGRLPLDRAPPAHRHHVRAAQVGSGGERSARAGAGAGAGAGEGQGGSECSLMERGACWRGRHVCRGQAKGTPLQRSSSLLVARCSTSTAAAPTASSPAQPRSLLPSPSPHAAR